MATRITLAVLCAFACLTAASAAPIAPPAYEWAARAAGVPASILFAVAREESGVLLHGHRVPWPWILNVTGVPLRFATEGEACAALGQALERFPSRRIDVGLGQIDVGYYGGDVARPCDLLNPYRNLDMVAAILRKYHDAGGGWLTAAGRYHRPAGGAPAAHYRHEVAEQLAQVLKDAGGTTVLEAALP